MPRTQEYRQVQIQTPLGDDVLLLKEIYGHERLGQMFRYDLTLLSEKNTNIHFDDIVGQNIALSIRLEESSARYINGFINSFVKITQDSDLVEYRATVVPWLWFLTRTADCRIFQNKTTPEIIKQVFEDAGFADFDDALAGAYSPHTNCVQYRETDMDFVSRLMEHEGIYYFFEHFEDKHVLVLADDIGAHQPFPDYEEIPYRPQDIESPIDHVSGWTVQCEVQPGAYAMTDFDFKSPKKDLLAKSTQVRKHAGAEFEIFDFPGHYTDNGTGDSLSRVRLEEFQSRHILATAKTNARGLCAGYTFKLTEHPISEHCREYLITETTLSMQSDAFRGVPEASEGPLFECEFTALDVKQPFRPEQVTPKPVVRGPQTAIVVGKKGEEIWTDEHGRVKVQFHWDRYSKADENSSCWIRVSQPWAGINWGGLFLPRIGQEVIVEFLEGDPDRPLITGRVYNGIAQPPYELPAHATMSTLKSNSTKGGGGFNEIRFEDKKGEEQVFIHAEKNHDLRIKNDSFEWIGNNRHLIVKTDKHEHIENNRNEKVNADHMEEIGKDRHLKIKGKEAKSVDGSHSFTVKGDVIEVFKANHSEQVTQNLYLKAMGVVIEAMQGITLKVGGSSVVIDPTGVTLKGPIVTLDGAMTKINSGPGATPASGKAGAAVAPASVAKAEAADDADPGKVAKVKARQRETKTGKYGATPAKRFKSSDSNKEKKEQREETEPTINAFWSKQKVTPNHNLNWPPNSPPTDVVPDEAKVSPIVETKNVPDGTSAKISIYHCASEAQVEDGVLNGLVVRSGKIVDPATGKPPVWYFESKHVLWDPWDAPFYYFTTSVYYQGLAAQSPKDYQNMETECLRLIYWDACVSDAIADTPAGGNLTTQAEMSEIAGILASANHHQVYQQAFNQNNFSDALWGSVLRNIYTYHHASHGDIVDRSTGAQLDVPDNPPTVRVNNWRSVIVLGSTELGDAELNQKGNVPVTPYFLAYLDTCVAGWEPSFANAFINRGTRNVIAFRMYIPDGDARQMARRFYKQWKDNYQCNPEKIPDVFFDVGYSYYHSMRPVLYGQGSSLLSRATAAVVTMIHGAVSGIAALFK